MKKLTLVMFSLLSLTANAAPKTIVDCGDVVLTAEVDNNGGFVAGLKFTGPRFTVTYQNKIFTPYFRSNSEGGGWLVEGVDSSGAVLEIDIVPPAPFYRGGTFAVLKKDSNILREFTCTSN